jgi:hypothetical protein
VGSRPALDTKRLGSIPTATGGITRLACARAREAGIELAPLLKAAGLTRRQIEDRGARVDVHHQIRFLNLAARALRDELIGFHLGQAADLRELGVLYYVAASSETLGQALQRAARYSTITNEGLSLGYFRDRDVRVRFNYVGVARYQDRHQMEFCMSALIRLCWQLTGLRLLPSRARLTPTQQPMLGAFSLLRRQYRVFCEARRNRLCNKSRGVACRLRGPLPQRGPGRDFGEDPVTPASSARLVSVGSGKYHRAALAPRQGACRRDCREARLEPAYVCAAALVRRPDFLGSSGEPAQGPG